MLRLSPTRIYQAVFIIMGSTSLFVTICPILRSTVHYLTIWEPFFAAIYANIIYNFRCCNRRQHYLQGKSVSHGHWHISLLQFTCSFSSLWARRHNLSHFVPYFHQLCIYLTIRERFFAAIDANIVYNFLCCNRRQHHFYNGSSLATVIGKFLHYNSCQYSSVPHAHRILPHIALPLPIYVQHNHSPLSHFYHGVTLPFLLYLRIRSFLISSI